VQGDYPLEEDLSRKQRRSAPHDNKSNRHIAPGDLNGQVPTIEDGTLKVGPAAPFAQKPEESLSGAPLSDIEMRRLLDIAGRKTREIGMDEKVDLREMTRRNGGQPPRFTVMKKNTVEAFKAKLSAAGTTDRMPRLEDTTARLMAALKANGAEVVQTVHSDWLRQPDADGKIAVPISDETRARLERIKNPGETDEDTINRILSATRIPNYPTGTLEYDVAVDLAPQMMWGRLDQTKAQNIKLTLDAMPVGERYGFLRTELIESLGPNDGTTAWSEKLGMLMAFVRYTLPEDEAHRLADEVAEKLKPAPADDHHLMDKVAREAAIKVERTLSTLPPDMASNIVTSLIDGNLMVEDGDAKNAAMPGFTDHVTKHLAVSGKGRATIQRLLDNDKDVMRITPEQRAKLQRYLDTGDTGPAIQVVKDKRRELKDKREELAREEARIDAQKKSLQAMDDIQVAAKDPRLTRLGEAGYHKAVQAWEDGSIVMPPVFKADADLESLSHAATIFVVQHNWSSAFEKATDFSEGEFRLPYSDVVFEFRISGRRVCCCVQDDGDENSDLAILLIETSVGWAFGAVYTITNGKWEFFRKTHDICAPIMAVCWDQIRAVSIALEAKVVETEIVRAPHRLNRKRERAGKVPVFDHHIVNLAHRKRYLPREALPSDIEDEHPGKRLHFVRGHTRHYTNHKVWINWHLRGNPDLGFVDKEYRL
jgi:hypothetical protein